MSPVIIKEHPDGTYSVNQKHVWKNFDDQWVYAVELTQNEMDAFSKHISKQS